MKNTVADIYAQLNSIEKSVKEHNDIDKEVDKNIGSESEKDQGTEPKVIKDIDGDEEDTEKSKVKKNEDKIDEDTEKSKVKKNDGEDEDEDDEDDEEESMKDKSIDQNEVIAKSINIIDLLTKNIYASGVSVKSISAKDSKPDNVVKSVIDQYNESVVCAKIGAALDAVCDEFCDIQWSGQDDESKLESFKDAANDLVKILDNISNDDDDTVTKSTEIEDKDKGSEKDNKDGDPTVSNESDNEKDVSKSMPEGKADSFKDGEESNEDKEVQKSTNSEVTKDQLQDVIIKSIKQLDASENYGDRQRIANLQRLSAKVGSGDEPVAKSLVSEYIAS